MKLNSNLRVFVAFFRRCLIYNVLIPFLPRFAPKLSLSAAVPSYLTTLNRLCQELFFRNFFGFQPLFPFRSSANLCSLYILSGSFPLVKHFFLSFFKRLSRASLRDLPLPEPRRPSPDSLFIISPLPPFVNTLFPILHIISACAPPWLYLLIYNTNFARFSPNLLRFSHYISTYNICF